MTHPSDPSNEAPVMSGNWGDATWEFFLSSRPPDPELCTAVGVVAIRDIYTEEVVLTLTEKGRRPGIPPRWELPSGHIDPLDPADLDGPKETLETAGARETLEETGFVVAQLVPFGYQEIINPPSLYYPEHAFMPYYWATTDRPLETPTDPDKPAAGSFSIISAQTLVRLGMMPADELTIIQYGLAAAQRELSELPPTA